MILVIMGILLILPLVLGSGFLYVMKEKEKSLSFCYVTGLLSALILAEGAQLPGLLFQWPLQRCIMLLGILELTACLAALAVCLRHRREWKKPVITGDKILILLLVLVQAVLFIWMQNPYVGEDASIETVQTMLSTGTLYQYHPFTGEWLEVGIPFRLQILVLPFVYAALSSTFGILPQTILYGVVPVLVLLACYLVYSLWADYFWGKDSKAKSLFLAIVGLLLQCGNYMTMTDSFRLFHRGYQGGTIRNAVILPLAVYLCMAGKGKYLILCIAAEAVLVWTNYGVGYTCLMLLIAAGIRLGIGIFHKLSKAKEDTAC